MASEGTAVLTLTREQVQRRADQFWAKVDRSDPGSCWEWTGPLYDGYGAFSVGHKTLGAYRFAYELLVGPVPNGLVLDHLCRNRACVNPAHLEPVTEKVNILRGVGIPAQNARKTHCDHGHEFTEENTYYRPGARSHERECRKCNSRMQREWRARRREKRALVREAAGDE